MRHTHISTKREKHLLKFQTKQANPLIQSDIFWWECVHMCVCTRVRCLNLWKYLYVYTFVHAMHPLRVAIETGAVILLSLKLLLTSSKTFDSHIFHTKCRIFLSMRVEYLPELPPPNTIKNGLTPECCCCLISLNCTTYRGGKKTEKDFAVFSHFKWKLPLSSCADLKWKLFSCIRWIFYTLSIFSVHGNRPNSIYQKKCYIYENQIKCAPQNKKVINSLSSCCDPAKQKQKICISANTSSECEKLVICSVSASFMICVCDDAFDCRSKWPFASTIQFG